MISLLFLLIINQCHLKNLMFAINLNYEQHETKRISLDFLVLFSYHLVLVFNEKILTNVLIHQVFVDK